MPAPSRWMIRCSLIYLLAGFTIGALLLISKAYPAYSQMWMLLPVHIEVSIFGWIIQLTMGTAYWILPRYLKTGSRGNSMLAKLLVILFNAGVLCVVLNVFLDTAFSLRLIGRLLELSAVALFIKLHWSRAVSYQK